MNKFVKAVKHTRNKTVTENGMETFDSSGQKLVDLFFTIGALRGQGTDRLYRMFEAAFQENNEIATRILLWARDVRGGAGERQIFRDVLNYMEINHADELETLIPYVPVYGRWDDLLVLSTPRFRAMAFDLISEALHAGDRLCAKWMPRQASPKNPVARELREHMGLSPKAYRKLLVNATEVVETTMCNREWKAINYKTVPSLAFSRYRKAFQRHDPESFATFAEKAAKGEVKVNASAVYPYDVIKTMSKSWSYAAPSTKAERDAIVGQWANLPNWVGDKSILPMVDVSGSMSSPVAPTVTAMDVAVSLGLYLADKNKGVFKDTFLTFSGQPRLQHLEGDIVAKVIQMSTAHWDMNTNLSAALDLVCQTAIDNQVPQSDMPETLVILSDMEFDRCVSGTAMDSVRVQFANAGYKVPNVVFWNIQSRHDNVPVAFNEAGVSLVSGFSPNIVKTMYGDMSDLNPVNMMMRTVMDERYNIWEKAA